MRNLVAALVLLAGSQPALAEAWTCTYPGFIDPREPVTVTYVVDAATKKVTQDISIFDLIENSNLALIAISHYAEKDTTNGGTVRVFAETLVIDKSFGKQILMVGEIGDEPAYAKGKCYYAP